MAYGCIEWEENFHGEMEGKLGFAFLKPTSPAPNQEGPYHAFDKPPGVRVRRNQTVLLRKNTENGELELVISGKKVADMEALESKAGANYMRSKLVAEGIDCDFLIFKLKEFDEQGKPRKKYAEGYRFMVSAAGIPEIYMPKEHSRPEVEPQPVPENQTPPTNDSGEVLPF